MISFRCLEDCAEAEEVEEVEEVEVEVIAEQGPLRCEYRSDPISRRSS